MRSMPFWVAASGGVLVAAALAIDSMGIELAGAALFAVGMSWFFVGAVHRSRDEGTRLTTALARGARDALRFTWYLMP
jgi:hypothetical protein